MNGKTRDIPPWKHSISGLLSGAVSTFVFYPLELIKTRLQVFPKQGSYRNFLTASYNVVKSENVRGLFAGSSAAMIAASGSWGFYFLFYEAQKNFLTQKYGELNNFHYTLSAIVSGAQCVLIFNPIWVVKTRMALQGAEHNTSYTGVSNALKTIYRTEGIQGLYRGLIPALFLTTHGGVQFLSYEIMKKWSRTIRDEHDQPAAVSATLGSVSKFFASTATYPYQVLKSRRQRLEATITTTRFTYISCIKNIIQNDGFLGFYRGFIPNVIKVIPSSAVTFVVYEEVLKLLNKF